MKLSLGLVSFHDNYPDQPASSFYGMTPALFFTITRMTEDTLSSNATVTSENTLQADELIQLIEGNQETAVKDYLQTAGEQAKVICSTAGSKGSLYSTCRTSAVVWVWHL